MVPHVFLHSACTVKEEVSSEGYALLDNEEVVRP